MAHPFFRHFCAVFLAALCFVGVFKLNNNNSKTVIAKDNFTDDDDDFEEENSERLQLSTLRGFGDGKSGNESVYFLGLFEESTRFGVRREGESEVSAARLAVDHVNRMGVLPGYTLRLLINDTKCDPGVGIDRFFHAIYSNRSILMLLGAGCSNVTEALARVVPYWNVLQVSFGSTSPTLSDRRKFPLFFRTATPDSSHNAARTAFIRHFRWQVVAILSQSHNVYLLPLNNLITRLERVNISCTAPLTFSKDNYREQLSSLSEMAGRIVVGSFSVEMAVKVFCEAYNLHMHGPDYVWILPDHDTPWWNATHDCPPNHLQTATEGLILISPHNHLIENQTSISNLTNAAFEKQLHLVSNASSRYVRESYDAIWAMSLALRQSTILQTVGLSEFTYKRGDMVESFVEAMEKLNFLGVSGPVTFEGSDRLSNTLFRQVQSGMAVDVAIFHPETGALDFNCKTCKSIIWQSGDVPTAQRIIKLRLITVSKAAFVVVAAVSICGMIACLVFLTLNLYYRRKRAVKLSSPRLNNVAVTGCTVVYLSVVLLGLDSATLYSSDYFSRICMVKVYLLSAGFSLAFGSMFAKTYRINKIFTLSSAAVVKDKLLRDKQLIMLILTLLVIDAIIISLWVVIDPMKRHLENLPLDVSSRSRGVVYQPQVEVCRSNNTAGWFIAIYGYKACLLLMGVYMAWETRHIKIQVLNDSQHIGISVYSAFSSAIVVVLSAFLSEHPTFSYLATSCSILASTTITLFLLFLPKLKGAVEDDDPIMQSMGLKFEYNTRRLVTNDTAKELAYRVQVQNKVYKHELEVLEAEIVRLERLLESPDVYTISKTAGVEKSSVKDLIKLFGSAVNVNKVRMSRDDEREKPQSDPEFVTHTLLSPEDLLVLGNKARSVSTIEQTEKK